MQMMKSLSKLKLLNLIKFLSRLTTSSTINESIYQLQRPNSSMSTSGTGPHKQRESIYFTVVQQPLSNHPSPTSTLPHEKGSITSKNDSKMNKYIGELSSLTGDAYVHENIDAKSKDQKAKHQSSSFIQRSKSHQLLTSNKLIPSTSELLHDDTNSQNSNDSTHMVQGSEPGSVKMGRRQLRFVIPQVLFFKLKKLMLNYLNPYVYLIYYVCRRSANYLE